MQLEFCDMHLISKKLAGLLMAVALAFASPASTNAQSPAQTTTPPNGTLGVEMRPINAEGGLAQLANTGTSWTRRNALLWSDVEPVEGQRNWGASAITQLESELRNAATNGLKTILIVRGAPAWALANPAAACGAINPAKLPAFAAFMAALVARYSVAPYGITHYEMWNEPDVDPALVNTDDEIGCWGDQTDPYYGGATYAAMLKAIYPSVKAANPAARVLVGGLVLDCNPNDDTTCLPGKFLEGILYAGGGAAFDAVSVHSYDWFGGPGKYSNGKWASGHDTTGPTLQAKARYVRDLLAQYGATGKGIVFSEIGIICYLCGNTGNNAYEETKMHYVPQAMATALATGAEIALWYNLRENSSGAGGFGTALHDFYLNERPAMLAYRTTMSQLNGATFMREVTDYPGIKVFEFVNGSRKIWAAWTLNGEPQSIALPSRPNKVTMLNGNEDARDQLNSVSFSVRFFEWAWTGNRVYLPLLGH